MVIVGLPDAALIDLVKREDFSVGDASLVEAIQRLIRMRRGRRREHPAEHIVLEAASAGWTVSGG